MKSLAKVLLQIKSFYEPFNDRYVLNVYYFAKWKVLFTYEFNHKDGIRVKMVIPFHAIIILDGTLIDRETSIYSTYNTNECDETYFLLRVVRDIFLDITINGRHPEVGWFFMVP